MRALYEIDSDIMSCFDEETGETLDEAKLDALEMEREQKIESVGLAIKNLTAFVVACKEERRLFGNKIERAEKQIEGYKHWLLSATEGKKFVSPKVNVSFRSSESVEISDEKIVPDEYLMWKSESRPDKNAIKQALKSGVKIDGCELVTKKNVQVK